MIQGKFFITPYAIQRYIERVRPHLSYDQALRELVELTTHGVRKSNYQGQKLSQKYPTSQLELWRGPRVGVHSQQDRRSRLRFVVAYDSNKEAPQVITILPVPGRVMRDCSVYGAPACQ